MVWNIYEIVMHKTIAFDDQTVFSILVFLTVSMHYYKLQHCFTLYFSYYTTINATNTTITTVIFL